MFNRDLAEQARHALSVALGDLLTMGMPSGGLNEHSTYHVINRAIAALEKVRDAPPSDLRLAVEPIVALLNRVESGETQGAGGCWYAKQGTHADRLSAIVVDVETARELRDALRLSQ